MAIFDGTHQAESLSLQNPEGGICLSQGLEIASRAVFVVQNPSHLTFTSNHPDLSNSGFFGDPPLSISEYCCTLKPTESMIRQISHRSATLGTTYQLFVQEVGNGGPRRLVVVLDGDDQFSFAVAAANSLATSGSTPPLLLLGVGYGGGYRSPINKRGRDYTPSRMPDELMENGGAEAFHGFLANELLPWAATQFEFVGGDVGITGNSLSGLFVLYALLRARPVFRRGLAGSPSIWWDDRSILRLIDAPLRASGALSCRLFMCAGEDDSPSMATDLTLFSNKLTRAPRNLLAWTTDRFPGLDHYTALPSSFRSGLRWLFADVVSGH